MKLLIIVLWSLVAGVGICYADSPPAHYPPGPQPSSFVGLEQAIIKLAKAFERLLTYKLEIDLHIIDQTALLAVCMVCVTILLTTAIWRGGRQS